MLHVAVIIEMTLLVLALACFILDTLGVEGIAGHKVQFLLRPLGLAFWTVFMLVKILAKV